VTLGDPGLGTEVETERRGPPPAHFDRQRSVPITDTKLAVAVSPIFSSDCRYRPTPAIDHAGVPAGKQTFTARACADLPSSATLAPVFP